jgi:Fe-S cluster assembly scaffold protein SufB
VVALNLERHCRRTAISCGRTSAGSLLYDYDGFTALNAAFLRDGAFVYVPERADIPVHLHVLHVTTAPMGPSSHTHGP